MPARQRHASSAPSRFRAWALTGLVAGGLALGLASLPGSATAALRSPAPAAVSAASSTEDKSCGAPLYKPNGRRWICTFADNFGGTSLDRSKWRPITTRQIGFTHGDCSMDSPYNIAVRKGTLRLTSNRTRWQFRCDSKTKDFVTQYTGATVSTWTKFAQTYGRYEFRAAFPQVSVAGSHSALWLFPVNPAKYHPLHSGEIDVAEFYSVHPDRAIPFLHYSGERSDANSTNNHCLVTNPTAFHTYILEWTRTRITIKYDNQVCLVNDWRSPGENRPAPFDHPFFINLTQATGQHTNQVTAETPFPASLIVDYVRVWR